MNLDVNKKIKNKRKFFNHGKLAFHFDLHQSPSNLISLTYFAILMALTTLQLKIRAIKWQKSPTSCLIW